MKPVVHRLLPGLLVIAATTAGVATACEAGSKPSLMGEDGDVSLVCTLSVDAAAPARRTLQVLLRWSHADYVDADLSAEPVPRRP